MHAILLSLGTDGDVYPYLGLGARLRSRGHRVTLAAGEPYGAAAAEHGLGFHALVSREETDELFGNPDFWHPLKAVPVVSRWGARLLERQWTLVEGLARDDHDAVLAASPAVPAARLAQEKMSVPLASVILQPWMIPSLAAPPRMPGGLTLPRWAPRPVGRLYWRSVNGMGNLFAGRALNRLRTSVGLEPVRRFFEWWLSPDLVIGMFPPWYGKPQTDWPAQLELAGFPLYDGPSGGDLSPDLLEFLGAGDPPVAFTFGTGMMHARRLYEAAAEACGKLGARGIFITRYRSQLPDPLPPFIRHARFAPFLRLFPRCSAAVHHGGVGTVAKALATGTPQLIVPFAYDQWDNAARVKRLGVGDGLPRRRRTGTGIARALARLMVPETRERCREIAPRFEASADPFDTAAGWIEELHRGGTRAASAGDPGISHEG